MQTGQKKAEEGDGQQSNFIFEPDKNILGRQKHLREIKYAKDVKTSDEHQRFQGYKMMKKTKKILNQSKI